MPQGSSSNVEHISGIPDPCYIRHPYLTALNLVVNAEFHMLVCQLCKEAIATPAAKAHIVNKHSELLSKFTLEHFQTVVSELQLTPLLPTNISGPRSIVHGLTVCDALACPHCPMVMTKSKHMREHHIKHHQDQPIPNAWRSCKAQRMKPEGAGSQRTFWEITSTTTNSNDAMIEELMKNLNKELENIQVPVDQRLVTPWLRITHWHEFVAGSGFSTDSLRQSIGFPQPDEVYCQNLHNIVECYFQQALELIETTDELVLQRINSPDPIKR